MECPGALVGIFPDDGEPQRFALGVADVDAHAPMSFDMHMRTGSIVKPFLGTVVLQLCDEKKLSLDDPVSKYVPDFPDGDNITLRMLGKNTSGIFNTIENKDFQKAIMNDPEHQWTPTEVLAYNKDRAPYNKPGERWRYSNTNAVLLGLCIEKVTGNTYAEEIDRRICQPLKLAHTAVPPKAKLPAPHTSAYRNGYPDKVIGYGNVFYNVSNYSAAWTGAAGNLYSTLDDLGRAAKPLATGALLSDAGKSELTQWIDTGHNADYGFCMYRRHGGIGHTGDVPGYNAFMVYYPNLKTSVVVLTNLSNNKDGTMPAEELGKLAAEHLTKKL
jgi:D-alanyl-D-alanine carboxypeptidase